MFPAVAVIQSLPVFDETRRFSLPLPAVLGGSLSFSYPLQLYLVLMFLGETASLSLLKAASLTLFNKSQKVKSP